MARPSNILVSTIKRNQRLRGPTSSEQQNDLQAELVRDLSVFQQEWNNKIVPMASTIPDGTDDALVNAFLNGLDGRTMWVKTDATNSVATSRFFNTVRDRPNTVYEQFLDVYDAISNIDTSSDSGSGSDSGSSFDFVFPIETVSSDTTLTDNHFTLLVNAASALVTITLPEVAVFEGRMFNVKKIDTSGNSVVLDGAGTTIDGTSTKVISIPYGSYLVQSNGIEWFAV